jgi:hypothetical protein
MTITSWQRIVFAALIVTCAAAPRLAAVEVIDRILAVVNGAPITHSDLVGAVRLGFVRPQGTADQTTAVLDRLIERGLMLAEVDRYAPPEPAAADIDAKVADTRARAGEQFDPVLLQTGMSLDQLRRRIRDDLRIEAYLQQRFGAISPTDEEILQYYREHAADFSQWTFDQVHDRVRAALVADRRAGTIRDWVAGLRRRANINVLPR